ncbi:MAG: hypothetical protein ACI87E_002646 [Mariniblastus sp.]|jgi:hypothetical protein
MPAWHGSQLLFETLLLFFIVRHEVGFGGTQVSKHSLKVFPIECCIAIYKHLILGHKFKEIVTMFTIGNTLERI